MRSRTTFLLPKLPHISFHLILDLKFIFLKFLPDISIRNIDRHFSFDSISCATKLFHSI